MTPWPLEKIPQLAAPAITAILQSLANARLQSRTPLAAATEPDAARFAETRWEALGLDRDDMRHVTEQANAMFHTSLISPAPSAFCGEMGQRILAEWGPGERPITFFTSGSTGAPKGCTHLESHLRQETAGLAPFFTDRKSVLTTVPAHHMYGFSFGLLLPLSLGIPLRRVMPLPSILGEQMRPGDLVVTIPLLLSRMINARGWQATGSGAGREISIVTATAPFSEADRESLLRQDFCVYDFYGTTETLTICCRRGEEALFTLLPHVARGCDGHPDTIVRRLPDGALRRYPLQDSVFWADDKHLRIGRRLDNAVQVGGVNVHPARIARILRAHAGVRECQVRLMRPEEGNRLKVFVVPEEGWNTQELRSDLLRYAYENLTHAERPKRITFGAALPRNPMGKLADW